MATVEVSFTALPAHVRTARLVATAVARRSGVPESMLDEVRLAVGEACSRAVEANRRASPAEPVRIALTDSGGQFQVEVTDTGTGPGAGRAAGGGGTGRAGGAGQAGGTGRAGSDSALSGFGIAVIAGLADNVQVTQTAEGTSVLMSWPTASAAVAPEPS